MDTLTTTDRERLEFLQDEFRLAEVEFNHSFDMLKDHEEIRQRLVFQQARAAERRNELLKEIADVQKALGLIH